MPRSDCIRETQDIWSTCTAALSYAQLKFMATINICQYVTLLILQDEPLVSIQMSPNVGYSISFKNKNHFTVTSLTPCIELSAIRSSSCKYAGAFVCMYKDHFSPCNSFIHYSTCRPIT